MVINAMVRFIRLFFISTVLFLSSCINNNIGGVISKGSKFSSPNTVKVSTNVANLVTSASNIVISPADGALNNAKQVFLLNTGTITATQISIYIPSPIVITNNTCGTTLGVNTSCSFFVNVNSGLSTNGQVSISISYNNSITTAIVSFNIIYNLSNLSPGITLSTNTNFLNTPILGGVKYLPIIITNTGSINFTNLQFNSIRNQNQYMNYGALGSTCFVGRSLAVGESCIMVVGYNPTLAQASSNVIIIPVLNYFQNGFNLSYTSSSLSVPYSTDANNNFVIIGDYGSITTSTAVDTWVATKNPPFSTNVITSNTITQGQGGIFVMGMSNGNVWGSVLGGMFWTLATSPGSNAVTDIHYANGNYYLVGGNSNKTIMSAPNLTTSWTTLTSFSSGNVNSLYVNNNATVFIACATPNLYTSSNGSTWTNQISGVYVTSIFDGANYFVFGNSGQSASSSLPTTASSWTARSVISSAFNARSALYNNGIYVAVGSGPINNIYTTTNPISLAWTAQISTSTQLNGVAFGNNTYVAVGNSGVIYSSNTGIGSWTARASGTTSNLLSVYYDGTYFWATGTAIILLSSDGVNWYRLTSNSIAYNNSTYLAVGVNGLIYTSTNLVNWTLVSSGTSSTLNYTTCIQTNLCIVVGDNGTILTSSNLTTWNTQASGTNNNLTSFACGFANCIIVGSSGTVLTTQDFNSLSSWSLVNPPTANNLNSVAYLVNPIGAGGNLYVAVGNSGTIITSQDRVSWTNRTSGVATNLNSVFCPSTFTVGCVAVGNNGVILTSLDGITWTSRTSGVSNNLNNIAFYNGNYIIAGDSNTILTSSNGTSWVSRNSNLSATTALNLRQVLVY